MLAFSKAGTMWLIGVAQLLFELQFVARCLQESICIVHCSHRHAHTSLLLCAAECAAEGFTVAEVSLGPQLHAVNDFA